MGEIEDIYRESVEKLDEDFLEKIKKTKNILALEEEYKKRLHLLREKYTIDSYKFLKNQKQKSTLDLSMLKEKNFKRFKSERVTLVFSKEEKDKIAREIKKFKSKRELREKIFRNTPAKLIYLYFIFIKKRRLFIDSMEDFFNDTTDSVKEHSIQTWDYTKELAKRYSKYISTKSLVIYTYLKEKFLLFLSWLKNLRKKNAVPAQNTTSETSSPTPVAEVALKESTPEVKAA